MGGQDYHCYCFTCACLREDIGDQSNACFRGEKTAPIGKLKRRGEAKRNR
uniref:Uncharacterized protein n=1 Tax=Rhizophora mucronata TaxID=61149 RepID=A0A2P2JA26_RHIMU